MPPKDGDNTNTGGPAFPYRPSVNDSQQSTGGMTLRDYVAAQVLPKLLTMNTATEVAREAYRIADAMLAERER